MKATNIFLKVILSLLPLTTHTSSHEINVGTRNLVFTDNDDPTITSHRFCAKHGILDADCASIKSEIASVQAEACTATNNLGLHIARPTKGEQIRIPAHTYSFNLMAFFPPATDTTMQANFTTCLVLISTYNAGEEVTTPQRCVTGAIPTVFPFSFDAIGYHLATVEIFSTSSNRKKSALTLATASVAFTTVSEADDKKAFFFDAFCDPVLPDQPAPHPMTRRPMAMLGKELMFRSTGTSNPGRNFPGFWLPSAGICPEWFLNMNSPLTSFHDIETKKINMTAGTVGHEERDEDDDDHQARQRMRHNALKVFSMIDKRFGLGKLHYFCTAGKWKDEERCTPALEWNKLTRDLTNRWRNEEMIDVERAIASGSGDTLDHSYMLSRFYSVSNLVTSIRLDPNSWRSNGYWRAARSVLELASEMGMETRPVVREDVRERVLAGICDVNQFIHSDLGFQIQGWESFYKNACGGVDDKVATVEL